MTKTGIAIYSGQIDISKKTIEQSDKEHVLFAGFISAILSISEETQESEIRELGYKEHKIIFAPTEKLIFLAFANQKVPNSDVNLLLGNIIKNFIAKYEDTEYIHVPEEMRVGITELVNDAFNTSFWWLHPEFTYKNNIRLLKTAYTRPGGTYFVSYLPSIYLVTALFAFLIPLFASYLFGTIFTGFSTSPVYRPNILNSLVPMLLIWLGTPLLMEVINRDKFDFIQFVIISGILFSTLSFMMFFSGHFYMTIIYNPIYNLSVFFQPFIEVFMFLAPINISFFFYVVLTAYTGSFVTRLDNMRYYISYLASLILMISIAEVVV